MKLEIKYSANDYYEASKLHYRTHKTRFAMIALGMIFFIVSLYFFFMPGDSSITIPTALFELFISAYFLSFPYVTLRLKTNYIFNRAPAFRATHIFEISAGGIHSQTEDLSTSDIAWKLFTCESHDSAMLLLYVSDRQFLIFPKRLLSDDQWNELMAVVVAHVGPKAGKQAGSAIPIQNS